MPARHCARSARLPKCPLGTPKCPLGTPKCPLGTGKNKKKRPRARALFPGRGRGRRSRRAHTPARDRSAKKGENDGKGVLDLGHASEAAPRSPGTKAKPIDFNDRRMSLEALDLPTERDGVRLAGRNGRAGGGGKTTGSGPGSPASRLSRPARPPPRPPRVWPDQGKPPRKGGKRRKGNAPARRSPSSAPPAKRVCGSRPTPKKKRVAPSPVRGPAPVPPPRRHGSPRR